MVGVLCLKGVVWLACGSVFGLGMVYCESGVLELVVDDGGGLWNQAGGNGDVEVVQVRLCEYGRAWVSWLD